MCRSNSTLLIQKLLKLQGNTTMWVQRSHALLTHFRTVPWLSPCRRPCAAGPMPPAPAIQSDQSFSSNSESSSESLYSTAMRLDKMVATSFPTGSRLASCSRCSCTFFNWIPGNTVGRESVSLLVPGEGKPNSFLPSYKYKVVAIGRWKECVR